ncbi:hypothetical protein GDO86_004032 [Hymenochirus boettgeri]|uniref:Nucleolus and neural progenitor protein-like N-terminal domain-containing protein n=2 Tax=Hymenochirus boettgeri TaxID=247094 RepID=A0A8T2K9L5_9PIPI|nr:hypothetical protein GDO86_004032 [Hymenochirus boettgeri]
MASEPWNRLLIPRPAIQSLVSLPLGALTVKHIKDVVERCISIKSTLTSESLATEKAVLHSMLYIYHHRLCYHKPYLALKQVEQCLKRLKAMDLEASVQEMLNLCPKYFAKDELQTEKHCSVPSQPIIELVSVKILGACKLILRIMDCCIKAFHLCVQHLYLGEFIVANVVLLGLLSRLWAMYRGILKKLISLYEAIYSLLIEVTHFQNMTYFKDFTFPTNIENYLGPVYIDIIKRKLPQISNQTGAPQTLNRIFLSHDLCVKEDDRPKPDSLEFSETSENIVDLGLPVQAQKHKRGDNGTFDVKALCRPLRSSTPNRCTTKQTSKTYINTLSCGKLVELMPRIQQAESFSELTEQLNYAIKSCKREKMRAEVVFFRKKYLKSNRLKHIEAFGFSLKKKMQKLKKSICKSLHRGDLKESNLRSSLKIHRLQWTFKKKVTHRRKKRKHQNLVKRQIIYSEPEVERTDQKNTAHGLDLNLCTREMKSLSIKILALVTEF